MRRYSSAPKAWDQYVIYERNDYPQPEKVTVFERDRSPRRSGLLDVDGNPILVSDDYEIGYLTEELLH